MSKQAARAFCEKIKSDRALADKLTGLGKSMSDDDVVRVAREAGFECSADDLDAVGRELSSELSDDDLMHVAGGAGIAGQTSSSQLKYGVQSVATFAGMKWETTKL